MLKTLSEGVRVASLEVAQPAKKLAKLDDEDANENDDGKALADEGYSYIRELEYQDGLMEDDEEEDDEEKDDEEAQPAKKPVKLGDKDSDEEDDSEDQPAQELEEKDADGEDDEEDQPAVSARPDAWVDGIPVYRRGKPVQSAIQGLRGGPQPQQPAVSARPDRPDAWVDGIPFYIRGRPGYKEPPRPIHPDEVGDEVNLPPGRLAEIEDMRKHLMQVRKAAEARESRRSDNAAGLLWPTFRTGAEHPKARIQHGRAGDDILMRYYLRHDTFNGAEVYIEPNVCHNAAARAHDDYYRADEHYPEARYPRAHIEHGGGEDELLKRYYLEHYTFAGAMVYIKPNMDSEQED
jgi:hypothetical protein